jgi:hypothetical protein
MKSRLLTTVNTTILSVGMLIAAITDANAASVSYTLENIFLGTTTQMTGAFEWTYDDGDFENGTGQFTELFIPGTTKTLEDLNVSFDINKSIEFSLIANLDNDGVDITLVLANPLTPTQSSLLDLNASKWSLGATGTNYLFNSGGVSLVAVPIPAAVLLFGSGVIGLIGYTRRKMQH